MTHITDENMVRAITAQALLALDAPVTVPRGENYARRLCHQIKVNGVDRGLVCRAVNGFVENGFVHAEDTFVHAYGSGADPVRLPARRLSPLAR